MKGDWGEEGDDPKGMGVCCWGWWCRVENASVVLELSSGCASSAWGESDPTQSEGKPEARKAVVLTLVRRRTLLIRA